MMLSLLCLPHISSFVSVVFDFNASLNDTPPFSLIHVSVYLMVIKMGGLLMDVICVHISNRVLKLLCLISMHHSMISASLSPIVPAVE